MGKRNVAIFVKCASVGNVFSAKTRRSRERKVPMPVAVFPASANLFSCGEETLFSVFKTLCSVRPSVKTLFSYE